MQHTLRSFDIALDELNDRIGMMFKLVRKNVRQCQKAFENRDSALAKTIIDRDAVLNDLEVGVDEAARQLIVHHQPAASDLRFVFAATKIVTDLERMGDLTRNIAGLIQQQNNIEQLAPDVLKSMTELVVEQLKMARRAFMRRDTQLARQVIELDNSIDNLFINDQRALLTHMAESPELISTCMRLSNILKQLERIADHAVNTAEMVIYMVMGREVRHISRQELMELLGEDDDED